MVAESPGAFERLLSALDFYHEGPWEIALIGRPDAPDTRALLRALDSRYLPNKVVALADGASAEAAALVPLLRSRGMIDGKAAAYVCRDRACKRPVTAPDDLLRELRHESRR
jgi:uncharacterized protein YyaL (SSP411 family)